jgi:DNA repair protein RadC
VELVREAGAGMRATRGCSNAEQTARLVSEHIGNATDREHFVLLLLDVRLKVIAIHTVSTGILDSSLVHAREVFKPAILAGARSIVLAHNHPSGDPAPSEEDLRLTSRFLQCGVLLGIEVLDHVIVGSDGRFVSLKAGPDQGGGE